MVAQSWKLTLTGVKLRVVPTGVGFVCVVLGVVLTEVGVLCVPLVEIGVKGELCPILNFFFFKYVAIFVDFIGFHTTEQ